jgi:hypothetical protein
MLHARAELNRAFSRIFNTSTHLASTTRLLTITPFKNVVAKRVTIAIYFTVQSLQNARAIFITLTSMRTTMLILDR